jgi:hypothetical protein
MKAQEKAGKKKMKNKKTTIKSSTNVLATTFPMTELNNEPARTTIPEELVTLEKTALKKADKRKLKKKLKEKKGSGKVLAGAFPMVERHDRKQADLDEAAQKKVDKKTKEKLK